MAHPSTPRIIKFSQPGVQPPVYLVGSFSSPPWTPQEMQYATKDGEHEFTKEVEVEAGQQYQYKIRIGESNWALCENDPKGTDEHGNENNVLVVPAIEDKPVEAEEDHAAVDKSTSPVLESEKEDAAPIPQTEEKTLGSVTDHVNETVDTDVKLSALRESIEEVKEFQKTTQLEDKHPAESTPKLEKQTQGIAEPEPTPFPTTLEAEFPATIKTQEVAESSPIEKGENSNNVEEKHTSPHQNEHIELESPQPIRPYSDSKLVEPEELHQRSSTEEEFPVTNGTGELKETTAKPFETSTPNPTEQADDSTIKVTKNFSMLVSTRGESQPPTEPPTPGQDEPPTPRAEDVAPYSVEIRGNTPDYALTAAEVAESAELLDQSPPTPPMSDDEAGRTGYRRMSNTPIPQVATTAAEVADTAAQLDKESLGKLELPPRPTFDTWSDDGSSYPPTPEEQRAPRFPYECLTAADIGPRPGDSLSQVSSMSELNIPEELSIEVAMNDPSITLFPTTLPEILRAISEIQARIPEDQFTGERSPRSPNFIAVGNIADLLERQSNSPASKSHEQSPSLDSIAEEEDGESHGLHQHSTVLTNGDPIVIRLANGTNGASDTSDEVQDEVVQEKEIPEQETTVLESDNTTLVYQEDRTSDQHAIVPVEEEGEGTTAEAQDRPEMKKDEPIIVIQSAISQVASLLPSQSNPLPVTPFISSKQLGEDGERAREMSVAEDGPSLIVQPPTPGTSLKTRDSDPIKEVHIAKSTSVSVDERSDSQLTARKQPSPISERPLTPTSMHSTHGAPNSRNFLKAFFRVVFVDWIGGLIRRLCGGGRHTLFTVSALLMVGLAVPYYSAVLLDSSTLEIIRRSVHRLTQRLPTLR